MELTFEVPASIGHCIWQMRIDGGGDGGLNVGSACWETGLHVTSVPSRFVEREEAALAFNHQDYGFSETDGFEELCFAKRALQIVLREDRQEETAVRDALHHSVHC